MDLPIDPRFTCDAILGGLARWLRAAGYDASWQADIDDWDLVRLAMREGRVLLTADTGIARLGVVRDGEVPSLLLPTGLPTRDQFTFVLKELELARREPRCMACGGELREVPKEAVRDRAPPRTYVWRDQFHECTRCGRLFWQGTHWEKIARRLDEALPTRP